MLRSSAIWAIRLYQAAVSPFLGLCCRFHPTCSEYMAEAISARGLSKGVGMGLKRLLKCHPWHPGGYDPVKSATMPAPNADEEKNG